VSALGIPGVPTRNLQSSGSALLSAAAVPDGGRAHRSAARTHAGTTPASRTPARKSEGIFDFEHLHDAVATLRKKQMFFIGGTIKSGTTWLQLLLDAHPDVSVKGEGHFFDLLAPVLEMALDTHDRLITEKNESIFNELEGYPRLTENKALYVSACVIAAFLVEQSRHKAALAVGEKSPDNMLHFAKFHTVFPTAKFIHVVRDGRDCAVSAWFHNLRTTPQAAKREFGSVDAFACEFAGHWGQELATAQNFANRHPDRVRQVRYEDVVTNAVPALCELFAFLGVPASLAIVERCVTEASFAKLSRGRNPGEEDRGSFFRKGIPGDWRNHLSAETNARFQKHVGGWLNRFGYG